jgi:hypothetical protein
LMMVARFRMLQRVLPKVNSMPDLKDVGALLVGKRKTATRTVPVIDEPCLPFESA